MLSIKIKHRMRSDVMLSVIMLIVAINFTLLSVIILAVIVWRVRKLTGEKIKVVWAEFSTFKNKQFLLHVNLHCMHKHNHI